jgi:hypothetical protein
MKQARVEVRNSPIHGAGVFAIRPIRKGTTIIEYLGDRVSHEAVDERYADKLDTDSHTFLFTVNSKIVIDAGSNGNDARFINHSCDPNCESAIKNKRVFIEAIRTIRPGEELNYDYAIGRDADDAPNVDEIFACRCGATNCRGSMLEPRKKPGVRRKQRARESPAGSRRKTAARGKRTSRGTTSRGTAARGKTARGKTARGTAARGKTARRKTRRSSSGRVKTAARSRPRMPAKSGARRRSGAAAGARRRRASKSPARRGR